MIKQELLHSSRLLLRPFELADAQQTQILANNINVARCTLNIPHPYLNGMAETWIQSHQSLWLSQSMAYSAILVTATQALIGCISLNIENNNADMGYWIGEPFWNQGYCSEAVQTFIDFGLNTLMLNCIYATHLSANQASGKVMQKADMKLIKKTHKIDRHGALQPACINAIKNQSA